MKIKAVLLLLLIHTSYGRAQQKASIKNDPDFRPVEDKIKQAIAGKTIPSMVIAVAKGGKIIYEAALGYADVNKKIKATIHTPYQLASATKPFTATAVMMLYEKGFINIDSPVTKYVPGMELKKADSTFSTPTVRQVLNHTAGLGTYFDIGYADEAYLFDDFESGWKRYGTIFLNPGTVSEYSNLGYGLLDKLISNVSGKTFADFMNYKLFKPLHLNDTYVYGPGHYTTMAAQKYNANGTALPRVINNTAGAGNIYASVHDLVRFGMYNLNDKNEGGNALGKDMISMMQNYKDRNVLYSIDKDTFYGLGWYVQPGDSGSPVVWHEGGMPGASTMLKFFPKEDIAIAVITNVYNYPFCREITDDLAKAILPNRAVIPINEMAGYKNYTSDTSLMGNWSGKITVDGNLIPASLSINKSEIIFDYSDLTLKSFLTDDQPLPHKTVLLYGMINAKYFIGTTTGILPANHLRREFGHLLIMKLLKRDNSLTGTITILAAAAREYYAYPFYIDLKKTP